MIIPGPAFSPAWANNLALKSAIADFSNGTGSLWPFDDSMPLGQIFRYYFAAKRISVDIDLSIVQVLSNVALVTTATLTSTLSTGLIPYGCGYDGPTGELIYTPPFSYNRDEPTATLLERLVYGGGLGQDVSGSGFSSTDNITTVTHYVHGTPADETGTSHETESLIINMLSTLYYGTGGDPNNYSLGKIIVDDDEPGLGYLPFALYRSVDSLPHRVVLSTYYPPDGNDDADETGVWWVETDIECSLDGMDFKLWAQVTLEDADYTVDTTFSGSIDIQTQDTT